MSSSKMIALMSSDGETFGVERAVAEQSKTIKHMIEDNSADTTIPVPNVTSKILVKVIEYCKRHVVDASVLSEVEQSAELKNFDVEFMKVDQDTLYDLILAAKFLEIESLFHVTCQTVGEMMKGKSAEEIRKTFNIKNDFTAEEEEEIRRENAWTFE